MLKEFKDTRFHYFINEQGNYHGEYKSWYGNGNQCAHRFFKNGVCHGEFKTWSFNGSEEYHFFYVDNKEVSFDEIPYPNTEEDRMFFKMKYDLPLRPVRRRRVKRN